MTASISKVWHYFNGYERIWLLAVTVVTIYIGGGMSTPWFNVLALSSFITGCIFVLLVAKGSLWNYPFGLYNAVTYAYVMYRWHEFGNVILYALFFTPMLAIGWFAWWRNHQKTHLNKTEHFDVEAKKLTALTWVIVIASMIVLTIVFRYFLHAVFGLDERHVWLDSFSVATPIVAQVLMNLRYSEQWHCWCLVNIANILLWGVTYADSGGSLADLISWIFFLINSVYGVILWRRQAMRGVH